MREKIYYNEMDKKACSWLRQLMKDGLLPEGDVDERSIEDVTPSDVKKYDQCHFFAGIGGWPEALRLAGWGGRRAWTGSCPCQPFSNAGQRQGTKDKRHLWPAFHRLIMECRPPVVFGEQVSSSVRYGWIDRVQADLEEAGYACGFHVFGAHSLGSPHIRQRLYWGAILLGDGATQGRRVVDAGSAGEDTGRAKDGGLADAELGGRGVGRDAPRGRDEAEAVWGRPHGGACGSWSAGGRRTAEAAGRGQDGGVADSHGVGSLDDEQPQEGRGPESTSKRSATGRLGDAAAGQRQQLDGTQGNAVQGLALGGATGGVADSSSVGRQPAAGAGHGEQPEEHKAEAASERGDAGRVGNAEGDDQRGNAVPGEYGEGEPLGGPGGDDRRLPGTWEESRYHYCLDGKVRRIPKSVEAEPIFQRVVDGLPGGVDGLRPESGFPLCGKIEGRTMLLSGYGNAIIPPVGASFVMAFMESINELGSR